MSWKQRKTNHTNTYSKYMCSGLILFYVLALEERVKMGKFELRTVKRRNSCKIKRDLDFLIDISGVSLLLSF